MTGIGGVIFGPPPASGTKWIKIKRKIRRMLQSRLKKRDSHAEFVVLCFRRTGSNWLSGMLFNHPQILMHNEIFNENAVHTYYKPDVLQNKWDYEGRDANPEGFLEFMYSPQRFAKFRTRANECKAVGYKSFPNHYLHKAVPLIKTYNAFKQRILENSDVRKIILFRQDVLRTYLSSRRAVETGIYMTGKYSAHKITVNLPHLQKFVDQYYQCYEEYRVSTRGHTRAFVNYEDLCKDPLSVMKCIWRVLGVDVEIEPTVLKECIPQSSPVALLRDSIQNYDDVEFACRHDPSLSKYLDIAEKHVTSRKQHQYLNRDHNQNGNGGIRQPCRWALLIPIRASPMDSVEACRERLQKMCEAIKATARPEDFPLLIFGIDDDDPVYVGNERLIQELCVGFNIVIKVLSGLEGKICRIWNLLAAAAYKEYNADFTLLFGDDVILRVPGWQDSIEKRFASIAHRRKLPYGAACVAFLDKSFPGFPTFPVINKWHFQAFGEQLPAVFNNQGGDPFLFELYKHFGASEFDIDSVLENTIGGKDQARYTKNRLRFEDNILTSGIKHIQSVLHKSDVSFNLIPCLDIVVPCYRCDVDTLQKVLSLRASRDAQISFWVVLDNPTHHRSDEVRSLKEVSNNYQVNILEHFDAKGVARNLGASAARNLGLGHSMADFCVLIDDDVMPSMHILDAYLGAIMRSPNASALVGSTHLPAPFNLLTHAIVACDIPG